MEIGVRKGRLKGDDDLKRQTTAVYPSALRVVDSTLGMPLPAITFTPHSTLNQIAAAHHRFGGYLSPPKIENEKHFFEYAKEIIETRMPTLQAHDVVDFDHWVSKYPAKRREYLKRLRESISQSVLEEVCVSKSFIKDEMYKTEPMEKAKAKMPRAIMSPTDDVKIFLGPIQEAIDKVFFKEFREWFVKGTDPKTWIEQLEKTFGGDPVCATDFSSFECHHRGIFSRIIHHWMMHALRGLPITRSHKRFLQRLVLGINHCDFSRIWVKIDMTLMSGVAWTSSGNGFLNYLICSYITLESKYQGLTGRELAQKVNEFKGKFEGDDGIFQDTGIRPELIKNLGVSLKLEHHPSYDKASFCSMVFATTEKKLCYEWKKAIVNLALPRKYAQASDKTHLALLRAKALSLKYMYGSSPVVGALCDKLLERTRSYDVRGILAELDPYHRDKLQWALDSKAHQTVDVVGESSRIVYEDAYGLTAEQQRKMEAEIKECNSNNISIDLLTYMNDTDLELLNYVTNSNDPVLIPPNPLPELLTIANEGRKFNNAAILPLSKPGDTPSVLACKAAQRAQNRRRHNLAARNDRETKGCQPIDYRVDGDLGFRDVACD